MGPGGVLPGGSRARPAGAGGRLPVRARRGDPARALSPSAAARKRGAARTRSARLPCVHLVRSGPAMPLPQAILFSVALTLFSGWLSVAAEIPALPALTVIGSALW